MRHPAQKDTGKGELIHLKIDYRGFNSSFCMHLPAKKKVFLNHITLYLAMAFCFGWEHTAAAQMYVHLAALLRKFSAAKTLSPVLTCWDRWWDNLQAHKLKSLKTQTCAYMGHWGSNRTAGSQGSQETTWEELPSRNIWIYHQRRRTASDSCLPCQNNEKNLKWNRRWIS